MPKQLDYRTGDSAAFENLDPPEILRAALANGAFDELHECEDEFAEGSGHDSRSTLLGLSA